MASLEKRGDRFRIVFRFAGQRFSRSLKTGTEKEANACVARLEDNLRRAELGLLTVPGDADVVSFLLSDGRSNGKPTVPALRTLQQVAEGYRDALAVGAVERSTLECVDIHIGHLVRLLGGSTPLRDLEAPHLQEYVARRSQERGRHGRNISPTTVKKELSTLGAIWTWGRQMRFVEKPFPRRGLKFPKTVDKAGFLTFEEIERQIARKKPTQTEETGFWDCLFLTLSEIAELLAHVARVARHPFIYPMFVFAAHTGARRSEMLRSQIEDFDLEAGTVVIREKKRARGKLTTRRVPLSPMLCRVVGQWLSQHPGGNYTFCHHLSVPRSSTKRIDFVPLTRSESSDHFKRTLAASKWEKLRGWHVLRHSFASNCAAKGIDQRIIDEWMGHQTEEMRRRYRHLFPDQQREAIQSVFGEQPAAATAGAAADQATTTG